MMKTNSQHVIGTIPAGYPQPGPLAGAMALYAPGGGYTQGIKAELSQAKKKYMAGVASKMAQAGLSKSTLGASAETTFAQDVAVPTLARAETERIGRLSDLSVLSERMGMERESDIANRRFGYTQMGMQYNLGKARLKSAEEERKMAYDLERLKLRLAGSPESSGTRTNLPAFTQAIY